MIYHVLPGDSLVEDFKKTEIAGQTVICRECLVVGDVDAATLPEFWDQRARFVLSEYGEDEIAYHDTVADKLAKLSDLDDQDEANLWFEYELFCSVNMWFCLWLLSETGAAVYRVEPSVVRESERWSGFALLDAGELQRCYDARKLCSASDVKLGADLWNAWRKGDRDRLLELGETASECFPYLREVCEAAVEKDTRPSEILAEIRFEGKTELAEIFPEFQRRAGVYGLGDSQVQSLLNKMP